MKSIIILFYLTLTIYRCIFSQDTSFDNENKFENNSLDSINFSIPESLLIDLISDKLQTQESAINNDFNKHITGKDNDTAQSFHIEDNQDYIENQKDNFPDTISYDNKDSTVYESDKPDKAADPDIIIVEDEDSTEFEETNKDSYQKIRLVIFVDHSQGMNLPRFKISPENLTYNGKPSYIFDFGIYFPFLNLFYGGISVKYLRLALFLSESYIISSQLQRVNSKIDTKEYLTFMSVPFEVGMRLKFGHLIPYIFMNLEPAFLYAAKQSSVRNTHFYFNNNGPQKRVEEHFDLNVRDNRTTLQLFFGGGIGLEIVYDYGSLFADIGCHYALLKTVKDKDYKSIPYRTSDSLIYFPISFGLRFYL